jgi:putative ABC transport system permease protein
LRSLYFKLGESENKSQDFITFSEVVAVESSGLAQAIPLYSKFTANGHPVVGTSLDYFDFRKLFIAQGDSLIQIGDCVVGSKVADELKLKPGDKLLTDIESVIAITSYPLKMHVRGILAPNNSADDWAVFVDLKTAWIIDGIGHGHQDVEEVDDEKLLSRSDDKIVASAAVLPYTEITERNIGSFHFHGDNSDFQISSIIAVPPDEKSETLLMGRYRGNSSAQQLVVPDEVINDLMKLVFQVKRFFDANAILIAVSTILLLLLIVMLSTKLRAREMQTMFKMGASRNTMAMLQLGELLIIFLIGLVLVAAASGWVSSRAGDLVRLVLLGS